MRAIHQQTIITLLSALSCFAHDHDQLRELENSRVKVVTTANNPTNLGLCEGDCDIDSHCGDGLYCFQRKEFQMVPGCKGGDSDSSRTDYCVYKPETAPPPVSTSHLAPSPTLTPVSTPFPEPAPTETASPTNAPSGFAAAVKLTSYGGSPPASKFPLQICQGDCDNDSHCEANLICFQRDKYELVPGCIGTDSSKTDYCIRPNAIHRTPAPDNSSIVTEYTPGKLTVQKVGLLLSEGLDARLIATSGQTVAYGDGSRSPAPFHFRPDAAATFPDTRVNNPGGWVYVSNSEMPETGEGGAGSLTFDKDGNILDYKMLLDGTTMNCGGGRTPWMTWVSCEELERTGKLYQVDPTGQREPQIMTLGSDGGRWESFAYDVRDLSKPHFCVTEDHHKGALARFTPDSPDWNNPWGMLHSEGKIHYLQLNFDSTSNGGTFEWIIEKETARQNARDHYPQTEGIDVHGSELLFVCKGLKMIYTLNVDNQTWHRTSTVSGLFDGQPDQLQRILQNPADLLYFTEEGGVDAGIHARDEYARFYTILESQVYPGETTGLSLSPDGRFMYVAYQDVGKVFCTWRRDGRPFGAEHLDVKFHGGQEG